ncbi:hypothetical protein G8759_31515 [Spirosoma aureum]|uniref:Site-specific integrase n=1 Tax=Spirosoma aureum TaxID=2692134 RepID=A0A6G9AWQ9_9BACT|nr:hypothetical protein [Spirosoma aureum]QIP16850.1 hypothetical protein G8759_31515 [Spirosoma aureum]
MAVNTLLILRQQGMEENTKGGKYPYKDARLSDAGGDLTKQWVVVYYAWDVSSQKLVRKRIRVEGDSIEERKKVASNYIKEINQLLKKGFHLNSARAPEPLPEPEPAPAKPGAPAQLTFSQATEFYKKVKNKELRIDTTMDLYDLYIRHFQAFLDEKKMGDILLKKITSRLAHEFFDQVDVGSRHRNNMLGFFKSFATFFIDREDIEVNPFQRLKNLKVDESDDHRPFTAEQSRAIRDEILATGNEQLWLFCQFIYFLFLRPGKELRLLQVRDILETQVKVVSERSKNRKIGFLDIPTALEQVIQHYRLRSYPGHYYVFTIDRKPGLQAVGVNYFYKAHRKILEKLELYGHDYDLYSWKPTGAVTLYKTTKDILRVQRHCRHSTPDQTYTYLRKHGMLFEGMDPTDFPAIWS